MSYKVICAAAVAAISAAAYADVVSDFDELTHSAGDAQYKQCFTDGGVNYLNSYFYDTTYNYESWSGWSYSRVNNTTTPGFANQFAAITGTDKSGSGNYGVCYVSALDSASNTIALPVATQVMGMYVTNTTYTYLAMQGDDGFMGLTPFADGSFLRLTITGRDAANLPVGSVDFELATGANLLNSWTWVDLTSLGTSVKSLNFTMASSDNHPTYGMNTPSYFAMDELTVAAVPEPMAGFALGAACLVPLMRRRRR